ncbi:MAG: hypothetical protein H6Q72_1976 [Firmicutes bacterium]|nr:hypothetical protein [Bacillota bacterium]
MEDWEIDMFSPEDAAGVVELYRAVYGENYPIKTVYDSAEYIRQSQGDAYRVVARTQSGKVIGMVAFFSSSPPNRELYEHGQLMVRPDYRKSRISLQLCKYALEKIPVQHAMETVWLEAVSNHIFSQKVGLQQGFCETGMEIDLMPGNASASSLKNSPEVATRVSALLLFRTYKPKPQTIYVPSVYEKVLPFLYEGPDYGHAFMRGVGDLPQDVVTVGKCDLFVSAGVARITFIEIGADFAACLDKMEQETSVDGIVVKQVFFRLTQPWTGAVVNVLRQRGYFISGCLPRWFDEDGCLMQKIVGTPNFDGILLYTKRSERILELVKQDWKEVKDNGGNTTI